MKDDPIRTTSPLDIEYLRATYMERPTVKGMLHHALSIADRPENHGGQRDKAGEPYMGHILRVVHYVTSLAPADLLESCQIAAALHDLVEDCDWTLDDLRAEGFAPEVVDAVDSLTGHDGESYTAKVERASRNPIGRWVKLADNRDNSDPIRLARLPVDKRERLEAKYRSARRILTD